MPKTLVQTKVDSDSERRFLRLKKDLHQRLIASLHLPALGTMNEADLRQEFRKGAEELCSSFPSLMGQAERDRLVNELVDETLGLGPLEPLLRDPTISDILINGPKDHLCRTAWSIGAHIYRLQRRSTLARRCTAHRGTRGPSH